MVKWNSLSLLDRSDGFRVLWNMKGEFEQEVMMGLVLACYILIMDYNNALEEPERLSIVVGSDEIEDEFELDDISDFPSFADISILRRNVIVNIRPSDTNLLLWVDYLGYPDHDYVMVELKRMDLFLQGFISMCNAFRVDFRDYIFQPPIDTNGVSYDIPAYDIIEYFTEDV